MISNGISLSRLAITGAVNLSTPIVVLEEIADAHGINYDINMLTEQKNVIKLINTINTTNVNIVREPYDKQAFRKIARFVNRFSPWKISSLTQAFDHLLEFTKIDKLSQSHSGFTAGPQTPENPLNYNACILYGICMAKRIDTRSDSTLDEMASNIEMLHALENPTIKHSIRQAIYDATIYGKCEGYQLINILSQIDRDRSVNIMNIDFNQSSPTVSSEIEKVEIIIDYNGLNNSANTIRNRISQAERRNRTVPRSLPRSHVDAVAMAAIYNKIDISKTANPLVEYQEINKTPYFPVDDNLATRIRETNLYPLSINNPFLDKNFNPELPPNLYEEEDMIEMCLAEGYTQEQIQEEGPYTVLQTAYFIPTFFHGKQGNITNGENTLLDEIDDIDYDNVVVWGIRGGEMIFYTYGELADTFDVLKRFQRPDGDNSRFTDENITKLYLLCNMNQRSEESDDIFGERIELAQKIDEVRMYQQTNQEQVLELYSRYNRFNNTQKNQVDNSLKELLECAMFMRGWNGVGPYPLSSEETMVRPSDQPYVDVRVTESIARLEHKISELRDIDARGDFDEIFKSLPLMFYNYRNGELTASTDIGEGLTIYDRINIVKGGENMSVNSCIRMSSNRFVASAYYYMTMLNIDPGFDIADMSHIA